ncbi:MAG TPA: ATP-dependent RNA helicase DbpA, partial [Epsilonproteobacteria bacterium]|nr:ATP-dependent RNA helicase DbpA [Campylobacterota bacterium]
FSPRESAKCVYVTQRAEEKQLDTLSPDTQSVLTTEWQTLTLNGGKKTKLRKGDILGTFCKEIGIEAEQIGQIDITETFTYVALHNNVIDKVQRALHRVKIKKKKYRSWVLD